MKDLLVIMAKEPAPGRVKTRLQPHLSPVEAADLYRCLLQDRLEETGKLSILDRAIAFAPGSARDYFSALAPEGFTLFAQRGKDLSERLTNIVSAELPRRGEGAISIIDSDSPDLPGSIILDSFRMLHTGADVVFGPCHDGGYYLVGMREPWPQIFRGVPWSSSEVLAASLEKARALGLETALLKPCRDIDTFADLQAFHEGRADGPGRGTASGRHTAAFIEGLHRDGRIPIRGTAPAKGSP